MTQTAEILKHLKEHGSITSYEAFTEYGATRLSAIIYVLKHRGWNIEARTKNVVNRYGRKVHFAEYVLQEEE